MDEKNNIQNTYVTQLDFNNEIYRIEMVAKGRATGYVFDTKADMDTWLTNSENIDKLTLGDNLYIRTKDVPDYWWDGSLAQELETQKVDLTEYMSKNFQVSTRQMKSIQPFTPNQTIMNFSGFCVL